MEPKGILVQEFWRVHETGMFPWPTLSFPNRRLNIHSSDILLKSTAGTYQLATGVAHSGIRIPDHCIAHHKRPITIHPVVEM